jgi:alpha-beta hydrolase superfamily lysophospholipase
MKVVSETVSIGGKDLFVHHWNKEKSNSSVIVVYHGFLGTFYAYKKGGPTQFLYWSTAAQHERDLRA